jgi:hypothetical protein
VEATAAGDDEIRLSLPNQEAACRVDFAAGEAKATASFDANAVFAT